MILILSSSFGTPIVISRSNLPALRKAESIVSGRLVQPITTTCFSPFSYWLNSSIQEAICATILTSRSFAAFSLLPAMLSSSSMNIMAGAFSWTPLKKFRIFSSDYPEIPVTISGPDIL